MSLIEEVVEFDHELERIAGGPGSVIGSGGMGSKLAAARIAVWSGIEAVIADAGPARGAGRAGRLDTRGRHPVPTPGADASRPESCGSPSPSARRAPSRWTTAPAGRSVSGAAPCSRPASPASVGTSPPDDAVELAGPDGTRFRQGSRSPPGLDRQPVGRASVRRPARGRRPRGRPSRRPGRVGLNAMLPAPARGTALGTASGQVATRRQPAPGGLFFQKCDFCQIRLTQPSAYSDSRQVKLTKQAFRKKKKHASRAH